MKLLIWVLILVVITTFFLLKIVSKKMNPIILRYATIEAKRFTTALINSAVDKNIINEIDNNLFTITKNKEGEIQLIDFNGKEVNRLLNLISEKIEKNLLKMEEGNVEELNVSKALKGYNFEKLKKGIVCEIPAGVLLGNSLFSNLGPTIPIKLSFLGQVIVHLKTAYLELYDHIEVTERITMPMTTEEQKVKIDIPLTMKILQGKVPNYFQSGLSQNSSLLTFQLTE